MISSLRKYLTQLNIIQWRHFDMLIGWDSRNNLNSEWFLDPDKCHDYIKHNSQSDSAGISVSTSHISQLIQPISFQLIVDALETNNDRKFLRFNDGLCGINIISNGWRFGTRTKPDNTGIDYKFAGGNYDERKGNIPTSLGKHNIISDARDGTITFNGKLIQDISTIPIPNQTYYFGGNNTYNWIATALQIMAFSDDSRAFYCKFYAMRLIGGDGTMYFDLRPYKNGSNVGLKNLVTNEVFYKSYGTGSFVYGTD